MRREKISSELLTEIKSLRSEIKRMSAIIEDRLIGVEEPTEEDIKAAKEFEKKKKKLKLIPLSQIK